MPKNDDEKMEILSRLGKDTHYLMTKSIKDWDEYDQSNWNALTLFTIFDKTRKWTRK